MLWSARVKSLSDPPSRRDQILEEGLRLISERGVSGASLRELARRVGISQPSLYHYFPTKDALVEELVHFGARRMLEAGINVLLPATLLDVPRCVAQVCLRLYEGDTHPMYVRFLFAVSIEQPRLRPLVQKTFTDMMEGVGWLIAPFVQQGQISFEEGEVIVRMMINAIGFPLLEERALWGLPTPTDDLLRYSDGAVKMMEAMIRMRFCPHPPGSLPGNPGEGEG